jgi:hypothetical protein
MGYMQRDSFSSSKFCLEFVLLFPFFSFGSGGLILYYVLCIKRPRCAPASGRGWDVRGGAGALHFNGDDDEHWRRELRTVRHGRRRRGKGDENKTLCVRY